MFKHYFRQMRFLWKENRVLYSISILGTALSICMIMVIIILFRMKTADLAPEINRSHTLYVQYASSVLKSDPDTQNNALLSFRTLEDVFYPLSTPKVVSATYAYGSMIVSVPGNKNENNWDVLYTDANFWILNQFSFIAGEPYDEVTFKNAISKAIIDVSVARSLYGDIQQAIGQIIELNFKEYIVCGVVKNVSKFSEHTYSNIWAPYTTHIEAMRKDEWGEDLTGNFRCYLLANNKKDFPIIYNEVKHRVALLNSSTRDYTLDIRDQPDNFLTQMMRKSAKSKSRIVETFIFYGIIITIILLVPAINLSGLTFSRMQDRTNEIGIRKAFGSTRSKIINQVLTENLILTCLGGLLGIILAYFSLYTMSDWLLASDLGGISTMDFSMIHPVIFLIAFLFCLTLNLLSAGVPAFYNARKNIILLLNRV